MTIAISGTTGVTLAGQFDSASTFGFKNRFINGAMQIAQRGTTGTSGAAVPTTTAVYPSVDRWFAYATGATVSVAQVAGSGSNRNNLQVTGAASVTAVGVGQRIESLNSYDLAGNTVTLSVNMSNSVLSTVSWQASYASSTDTWATKTTIATGSFSVTGTLTNYTAQIVIPAAATTGIEILFTVGAQTSGTWVIGNAQLEKTTATATTFDYRPYGTELALCQRYYYLLSTAAARELFNSQAYSTTAVFGKVLDLPVTMRVAPAVSLIGSLSPTNAAGTQQGSFSGTTLSGANSNMVVTGGLSGSSGLVAGNSSVVYLSAGGGILCSAEL